LADTFVRDPNEIVKVQQRVSVTVLEVDIPRKRISLSMKSQPGAGAAPAKTGPKPARTEGRPAAGKPQAARKPERRPEAPMNDWAQQLKRKFGN